MASAASDGAPTPEPLPSDHSPHSETVSLSSTYFTATETCSLASFSTAVEHLEPEPVASNRDSGYSFSTSLFPVCEYLVAEDRRRQREDDFSRQYRELIRSLERIGPQTPPSRPLTAQEFDARIFRRIASRNASSASAPEPPRILPCPPSSSGPSLAESLRRQSMLFFEYGLEACTPQTPPPPPPMPQTTTYWTTRETRQREYAAIDRASTGLRGWVRRNISVPRCFAPTGARKHVPFDDDSGSIRRYRVDEDAGNDEGEGEDETKTSKPKRSRKVSSVLGLLGSKKKKKNKNKS